MLAETNKQIVRNYIEQIWGHHNQAMVLALVADDYIDHNPPPGVTPDRDGLMQSLDIFGSALPNAELTLDSMVAEGDLVADRWTLRGTLEGIFFGIAPAGQRITLTGMDFHRIVDGKIAETWHIEDILGLLRQLGVTPGKSSRESERHIS